MITQEEQPQLESAKFEFSQEGNCVEGGEFETLEIRMESSLGIDRDGGAFYILKTDGWAIEGVEDLQKLFDRINKVLPDGKQ
jgi:hypothetical protein